MYVCVCFAFTFSWARRIDCTRCTPPGDGPLLRALGGSPFPRDISRIVYVCMYNVYVSMYVCMYVCIRIVSVCEGELSAASRMLERVYV